MNKKIALITGVTGQDGSYLAELLLKKGYEVHGIIRRSSSINTKRIDHIYDQLHLHYGDLTDSTNLVSVIQKVQPTEIYNLGAQSISSDSLCPLMTAQGITYRTLENLWDEQVNKNKQINYVQSDDCGDIEVIEMPENTQIKALGYWNGMGSWFKIKQISRHMYTGQICKLTQKFGSIKVTPNHSILDVNQKVRMPIENPWLLNVRKINYDRNIKDQIDLKLDGVYEKDDEYFWLNERGKNGKVKRNLTQESLFHFCKFIGAFVSEGHTTYNKKNDTYIIGISEQRKEWLEDIKKSLMQFFDGNVCFIKHKKENYDDVWELQIKSRGLYSLLRKICGENSKTKKLPQWVFSLSDENLKIIFDTLIEGDGCYTENGNYRYTTSSYELACQFSMLNTFLGYDYTINEESGEYYHFRECKQYQINQGNSGKKIEMVDYNGYVYDISVDEVCNFTTGVGNIVVHNSHVKVSFEMPEYTGNVDGLGTLRILEAVRLLNMENKVRIYQASTSELYGLVQEVPQKETTPFYPRSPYGVAKLYGYWIVKNYRESYGLHASSGILFNHESPRRGETFVTRKITRGFSRISTGEQNILYLGNLNAKRDWGHSKDFVEAMWLMLQQDEPDDYVIATGKQYSVREFVEAAAPHFGMNIVWEGEGLDEVGIDKNTGNTIIRINPKYFRPAEVETLLGDASKAKEKLGWEPKMTFKELVEDMCKHEHAK